MTKNIAIAGTAFRDDKMIMSDMEFCAMFRNFIRKP